MKILVEGDQALAASELRALAQEGHVVEAVARDAAAAQVGRVRYDLVILDVAVPSIDGRAACAALRASGGAAILMLSARAEAHERVAGLDAGADDFLAKPFDLDEFLARVRALGRRRPVGRGAAGASRPSALPEAS